MRAHTCEYLRNQELELYGYLEQNLDLLEEHVPEPWSRSRHVSCLAAQCCSKEALVTNLENTVWDSLHCAVGFNTLATSSVCQQ